MKQCYEVVARFISRHVTPNRINHHMRTRSIVPILAATSALASFANLTAGESSPVAPAPKETSFYDDLWALTTLYSNKDNPFLQELKLTGRAHFDLYGVDADQGDASDLDVRRLRFGLKAKALGDFTLHVEADTNPEDPNPFYTKLTDAYLAWEPDKAFKLTIGKQSMPFTLDGRTSSNSLITIDRGNLANNMWFPAEYIPGVSISGVKDEWSYRVGVFTNGTETPEFGDLDGSWMALVGLGYDFGEALSADKALLAIDYVYQDPTEVTTFSRSHENVFSVNLDYQEGRLGLGADVTRSTGYGSQIDLFGFMVMPSYYLIDKKLQAVARYTYISSDDPRGVRFSRYENQVVSGRGDEYQEIYAGLNYFLYGHKLKLQAGVQYTVMEDETNSGGDYDGLQGVVGLRMSW